MQRSRAFTRTDLLASIVVIFTFIGVSHLLIGADDAPLKADRGRRASATQLRGIHVGMVIYSQGNKDFYPGLDSNGTPATVKIPAAADAFGTKSTTGDEPLYRMVLLVRGRYFAEDYLISPFDDVRKKPVPTKGKDMTTDNFSFAMLRINDKSKRVGEWKMTNNSRAVAASDRNTGQGAGKDARSIARPDAEAWEGTVVYNDNHAAYEKNPLRVTEYDQKGQVTGDDLFADDKTERGEAGADAAMVYQDAKTYADQK